MNASDTFQRQFIDTFSKGYTLYQFFLNGWIGTGWMPNHDSNNNVTNFPHKGSNDFSNWIDKNDKKLFIGEGKNSTALKPVKDIDLSGILVSSVFNFCLFLVLLLSYEVLRRYLPNIYANKYQRENERQRLLGNEVVDDDDNHLVPLSWLGPVFGVPWSKILEEGGLDAYMYLRYIRMCLRITSVSAFWAMIILWPVYGTGGGDQQGLYLLSLKNIKNEGAGFWVSVIFMYLFTMYSFYAMEGEFKHFITLRLEFLGKGLRDVKSQHQNSLLVENIPTELRSDRALFSYFDQLFPGKVHSARVVVNLPELNQMSARKIKITRRLEKSIALYEATQERPTHAVGSARILCLGVECTCCDCYCRKRTFTFVDELEDDERAPKGTLVDSVDYYTRDLKLLNHKFLEIQKEKNEGAETGNVSVIAENWFTYIAGATSDIEQYFGESFQSIYGSFQDSGSNPTPNLAQETHENSQENLNSGLVANDHMPNNHKDKVVADDSGDGEKNETLYQLTTRLGFDFISSGYKYVRQKASTFSEEQSRIGTMSSTGFVTFVDLASVTSAVNTPLTHEPFALLAEVAPERRDVYWENAHVSFDTKLKREYIANISLALGAILWSIPVAAIQALASVDSLAKINGMEWLKTVFKGKIKLFIDSYLPVVAMLTLMMVLPIIFQSIAVNFERRKSWSDIQQSVVGRYFYYQLVNVYIVVTAGSIWNSLSEIIDHPGNIFEILGNSLPVVVGYFASLLITKILAGLPLVILRTGSVLRFLFLRMMFSAEKLTQRELDEVYREERLYYDYEYPNQLFVIVICITYVCIAPIILVVGAIYFLVALIVYKKQILFVYTPQYESGGTLFPLACKRIAVALILGQLTFIGYLVIRKSYLPAVFTMPLLILTPWLMERLQQSYVKPSMALTLERAVDMDKAYGESINSAIPTIDEETELRPRTMDLLESFRDDHYRQPVLTETASFPLPYRRGKTDLLTEEAIEKLRGENTLPFGSSVA